MQLTYWQRLRTRVFLFVIGVRRHLTLGVRVALIDGDRVFLIRHSYLPGWQFAGGGVEPGETAELSGARELLEETGYRPSAPMQLFGLYLNVNVTTNRDHVALYLCRDFEAAHQFVANDEIAEAGWFAIDALPQGVTPNTVSRIEEIFHGAPITALW